jgi:hypothetical protein
MLKSFVRQVFNVSTPFTLQSIPEFPYSDWLNQQTRYLEYENWYTGAALDEKITDSKGNQIDKFPLKLNPIPNTAEKHTALLLGNTLESIRDGGVPVTFIPETPSQTSKSEDGEPNIDPAQEKARQVITDALVNAFLGGGGGSLFVSNAILSQYLGGSIFGVRYTGNNYDKFPVQVIAPLPTEFIAFPEGNNFWDLREAWFVREISWMDAKAYGYPVPEMVQNAQMPTDVKNSGYNYWYIEHWTKEEYSCQVNEMVIKTADGMTLAGTNPYGVVPFVYIPHIRTKAFLGNSMITPAIMGIIKEMNSANADIGDAVKVDTHSTVAVRGVRGTMKPVRLPNGKTAVDLGSAAGLGTAETQPDMFAVETKSASEPQLNYTDRLDTFYRVEARHPAVADGLDEGSQRSSLTLTTRMWPMQSHVELERIEWTTGLLKLAEVILIFCSTKSVYNVTQAHLDIPLIVKWATMLPRDRAELVNEIAVRKKNDLISRKHGISLFGDVDNIEQELADIDQDKKMASELAIKEAQATRPPTNSAGEDLSASSPDATNFTSQKSEA